MKRVTGVGGIFFKALCPKNAGVVPRSQADQYVGMG